VINVENGFVNACATIMKSVLNVLMNLSI
jgi:hypothetical protein